MNKMFIYLIKSKDEKDNSRYLYWNNTEGWIKRKYATTFTKEEHEKFNLPTWSIWVKERSK